MVMTAGTVNWKRIWLAALVGAIAWTITSWMVGQLILGDRYEMAQQADQFLVQPRYPFFTAQWMAILLLLSLAICWLWTGVREAYGTGAWTALRLGLIVGFAAGFPMNFATAAWSPIDRIFPFWWMIDMVVGSVVAAFVAKWLYR